MTTATHGVCAAISLRDLEHYIDQNAWLQNSRASHLPYSLKEQYLQESLVCWAHETWLLRKTKARRGELGSLSMFSSSAGRTLPLGPISQCCLVLPWTYAADLLRIFHLFPLKTLIPGRRVGRTSSFYICSWGLRHWWISFSQCLLGAPENLQVPCTRKPFLTSRYNQPYFWVSTESRLTM